MARQMGRRLPRTVHFDDLYQEGLIGLLLAYRRYEPGMGTFETYARARVYGAMLDYLRRVDPLSRLHRKEVKAGALLVDRDWSAPEVTEPAHVEFPSVALRLQQGLMRLNERERYIIRRCFWEGATQAEVARELGLCDSRVCQMRKIALGKMRRRF